MGAAILLLHLDVVAAAASGVTSNQGGFYALWIPLLVNCVGAPIGLVMALVGFCQPNRNRKYAALGLGLTLVAPVAFVLFSRARDELAAVVAARWHCWLVQQRRPTGDHALPG